MTKCFFGGVRLAGIMRKVAEENMCLLSLKVPEMNGISALLSAEVHLSGTV